MRYKNSICSKAGVLLLSIALILIVMPMANAEECDCQIKKAAHSQSIMYQFIMHVASQQDDNDVNGANEACLVACMFAVGLTAGVILLVLAGLEGGGIYSALIAAGVAVVLALAILECYGLCGGGGGGSSISQIEKSDVLMQTYGINRFWLAV